MKKLFPLLAIVFIGAGCAPSTTQRFGDSMLGISFEYPTAWGGPQVTEERGTAEDGKDCMYQTTFSFPGLEEGMILMALVNTGDCDPLGRGGYWGDNAKTIRPDQAYMSVCESDGADLCETFKTKSGETVWHYRFPKYEVPFQDTVLTDVDEYSLYHEGHEPSGIMISEERLLLAGHEEEQAALRAFVESITFVD